MTKDLTESELIELIKEQSREGFTLLYEHYSQVLYGVLCRIVNDTELADSMLQDVFGQIWRTIDQYDSDKGRFSTWVIRIARHIAISHLRSIDYQKKQKVESNTIGSPRIDDAPIAQDRGPLPGKAMIDQIEGNQREIIDLLFFEGCTFEEASSLLDIPVGTLRSRVLTALQIIRVKI